MKISIASRNHNFVYFTDLQQVIQKELYKRRKKNKLKRGIEKRGID